MLHFFLLVAGRDEVGEGKTPGGTLNKRWALNIYLEKVYKKKIKNHFKLIKNKIPPKSLLYPFEYK